MGAPRIVQGPRGVDGPATARHYAAYGQAGGGKADVITVEPSRCKRCGSTRRGDYYGKTEQAFRGEHNGQPFTHIVRRRTKCLDCGQVRIDRAYENRPEK